ncbi:MAG: hypothetical protein K2P81_11925 [Bacteriovoracaceae bacterium]|nr:hypothetical protein [Bacteriovoracaceae bacterium]
MKTPVYLSHLKSSLPTFSQSQGEILKWIKATHLKSESLNPTCKSDFPLERMIERYAVKESLIEKRHFECVDLMSGEESEDSLYKMSKDSPSGAGIDKRNQFYHKRALEVAQTHFPEKSEAPHHLIHVSCTGYVSPSAAQSLVAMRKWDTSVTHAYHMGCYASLPAIRMAKGLSVDANKTIDLLHNEMCSLHMNPNAQTPEQIVVQSLFADGHISYKVGPQKPKESCFEILAINEKVVPESTQDMSWAPAPWGMQMNLSKDVPGKLKTIIRDFYWKLVQEAGLDPAVILKEGVFAIHPGGPKIIESIKEELELTEEQVASSKFILKTRGNMSSATLPHVWENILSQTKDEKIVISFAFGPGLTIFGSVFKIKP